MGNTAEVARRIIAQRQTRSLNDTETLDLIAGLLNGTEWGADTAAQIASFVSESGREVTQLVGEDYAEDYDPDEGEHVDLGGDPDNYLLTTTLDSGGAVLGEE